MARRARAKFPDPHYWTTVEVTMHCWLGDHECTRGTKVRLRRGDVFRRASCEICLKDRYGIVHRPFTSSAPDDAVDARAKRAGGDD